MCVLRESPGFSYGECQFQELRYQKVTVRVSSSFLQSGWRRSCAQTNCGEKARRRRPLQLVEQHVIRDSDPRFAAID
jgi:hypothetical protein